VILITAESIDGQPPRTFRVYTEAHSGEQYNGE
jgi:hypothetical protein